MRILILFSEFPFPADDGGKLRSWSLASYLARHHEVSLCSFSSSEVTAEVDQAGLFRLLQLVPLPPSVPWYRRAIAREPSEVIQFQSEEMWRYWRAALAEYSPEVIIVNHPALTPYVESHQDCVRVLDYLMVQTLSLERHAALSQGLERVLWRLRHWKQSQYHRRAAPSYDLCLVNSLEDQQDLLSERACWRRVEYLPNGLDLERYPLNLTEVEPYTLIYPGSIKYPPNRDAVAYFVDQILPQIVVRCPQVRLLVTGAMVQDGSAPQSPHVRYTGYVDDIRRTISGAAVCVIPLRLGAGGTRFKLLEALALGTPVVTTSIGAEGMEFAPWRDFIVADEPEAFAQQVVELLESPAKRDALRGHGRRLMEEKYSWQTLGARMVSLLEDLVSRREQSK